MQHIITDDELAALRAAPLKTIRDFRRFLGEELKQHVEAHHGIRGAVYSVSLDSLKKALDAAEDRIIKSTT